MADRCDRCRFWLVSDEYKDYVNLSAGDTGFGWCRMEPPRIIEHVARMTIMPPPFGRHVDSDQSVNVNAVCDASSFPATFGASWCGKYEAKGDQSSC